MKKKTTRGVFFNFLRRKHCLKEYIAACNKNRISYNANYKLNDSLKTFLQTKSVMSKDNIFNEDSINAAFGWSTYPLMDKGTSWRSLHEQWKQFLYENIIN